LRGGSRAKVRAADPAALAGETASSRGVSAPEALGSPVRGRPQRLAVGGDRRVVGTGGARHLRITTDLPPPGILVDDPRGIAQDAGKALVECGYAGRAEGGR
ncbi:hypothetical protein, partial [Methylobacterium ajmalii]|uniref:hypothetical protein n=1 Tax=Methylobacterium ajmalii TaxID=2738439 RepID=UPI001AEE69F8